MNLRHLAEKAKLSPSAVSLALRDSPKISAATKRRVRLLADKLGYQADANVVALMRRLRQPQGVRQEACFGVISFYDEPRPWERSLHLTRIYEGMRRRAGELGYRLEPLWLRERGMTYRRFEDILDARGIEGLLCFGSPDIDQDFPPELDNRAVVTVGLSIRTPMHRVTSRFFDDTMHLLDRVHQLGYRRLGLVVGHYEDSRSGHAHTGAYLAWCEHRLGPGRALPVQLVDRVDPEALQRWLRRHEPDALIFVHRYDFLAELRTALRQLGLHVPRRLGVAVLSQILEGSGFSGLQQNQPLMGAWAVELLVARITHRDFGIPTHPRIEMVESKWVDQGSLRQQSTVDLHSVGPSSAHR